jgi:hypothetical protein
VNHGLTIGAIDGLQNGDWESQSSIGNAPIRNPQFVNRQSAILNP